MDYHADRFQDHSLIAYLGKQPVALLPANLRDDTVYSHEGLTFGGWITDTTMQASLMVKLLEQSKIFLSAQGVNGLIYKCIPHIYHTCPAEEDMHALFLEGAHIIRCDVTAAIDYRHPLPFSSRRDRGIRKAKQVGILCKETSDYEVFFSMLSALLKEKYDSTPTHSLDELLLLRTRFPSNIKLFSAYKDSVMLAGVTIYESKEVAHVQYIASTEDGRKNGALDALFEHLILDVYSKKRYFDFGTSNDKECNRLNETLIQQKEEFGARAVAQYICKMPL